jgi:hypothetical protein
MQLSHLHNAMDHPDLKVQRLQGPSGRGYSNPGHRKPPIGGAESAKSLLGT